MFKKSVSSVCIVTLYQVFSSRAYAHTYTHAHRHAITGYALNTALKQVQRYPNTFFRFRALESIGNRPCRKGCIHGLHRLSRYDTHAHNTTHENIWFLQNLLVFGKTVCFLSLLTYLELCLMIDYLPVDSSRSLLKNLCKTFTKGLWLIILTIQGCVKDRPDSFKEKYDPKESEQIRLTDSDRSKRFVQSLKRLCQRNIIHYLLISNFIDFLCLGLYIYRTYRILSIPGIVP